MTAPTLILWGDQDAFSDRVERDSLAASIRGAELVTYAGAGHALHWEDPERVAVDLTQFCNTHATAVSLSV